MGLPKKASTRNDLFKRAVAPILLEKTPYVSQDALNRLKISLKHLDLTTGDIGHKAGTTALMPMPPNTLQDILDSGNFNEPSVEDHTDFEFRGDETWAQQDRANPETRFYEAKAVHDIAAAYVFLWEFPFNANWRQAPHETTYLQRLDDKGRICYQIQSVCEPFEEWGVLDAKRPFVVAYQLDQNRLVEGQLLASELNALIVLATKYDMDPAYAGFDEYIITVITGCDRQVRVAQSRVNLASNTFDVSLSKIMDFENQIINNWEEWKTLLGWSACSTGPRARES